MTKLASNSSSSTQRSPSPGGAGLVFALLAYGAWGLLPIYWKFFQGIPAVEVLTHRIIWSALLLSGVLLWQGRRGEVQQLLRSPKTLGLLLLTACVLSGNWGLYIYGVNANRVVETSLGYFINPLLTVLLGFVFLRERLQWGQTLAVLLAAVGVGYYIWQFGAIPWIGLGLAVTFGTYGLLRKLAAVAPMVGLAVETLLITPVAIAVNLHWATVGASSFGDTGRLTLLFIGAGVITSLPLLWFNNAAKRLQLSTLGICQYLAPSLQLLLAVGLYREPFTLTHGITFGCIWLALGLYSVTAIISRRSPS